MKKVLLLGVCSFLFLSDAQAGKFKEITLFEEEGHKPTNKVILRFDDDEGRREVGATVETGNVKILQGTLEESIKKSLEKGLFVVGLDFSNSDLMNEDFNVINSFVSLNFNYITGGVIKIGNFNYNLDETDVDLFKENIFIKDNYEEKNIKIGEEDKREREKSLYQGYKPEIIRVVNAPKSFNLYYDDNKEDYESESDN